MWRFYRREPAGECGPLSVENWSGRPVSAECARDQHTRPGIESQRQASQLPRFAWKPKPIPGLPPPRRSPVPPRPMQSVSAGFSTGHSADYRCGCRSWSRSHWPLAPINEGLSPITSCLAAALRSLRHLLRSWTAVGPGEAAAWRRSSRRLLVNGRVGGIAEPLGTVVTSCRAAERLHTTSCPRRARTERLHQDKAWAVFKRRD